MLKQIGISLGSNLGNREEALSRAIDELKGYDITILKTSGIIETSPDGFESEHSFLNMAVLAETEIDPETLLQIFKTIESGMGRLSREGFYADRIIDLDLIFYGDRIINKEGLTVPHPKMHERLFVLEPFFQIMPQWKHPVLKETIAEMRKKIISR